MIYCNHPDSHRSSLSINEGRIRQELTETFGVTQALAEISEHSASCWWWWNEQAMVVAGKKNGLPCSVLCHFAWETTPLHLQDALVSRTADSLVV